MAELAVIGLGRFGRAVARSLVRDGQAVLAIDHDPARLALVAEEVDATARADTTDEGALAELRLGRLACVVVTIGSRASEASILTVAILRELGVPRIVARAFDERHARLLLAIGAHEVLNPEDEMGARLALHVARPGILDRFRCAGGWVAQVEAPEAFAGTALGDLDLGAAGAVEVLAVRRGDRVTPRPEADWRVESGDVLVVFGEEEAVHRIEALR